MPTSTNSKLVSSAPNQTSCSSIPGALLELLRLTLRLRSSINKTATQGKHHSMLHGFTQLLSSTLNNATAAPRGSSDNVSFTAHMQEPLSDSIKRSGLSVYWSVLRNLSHLRRCGKLGWISVTVLDDHYTTGTDPGDLLLGADVFSFITQNEFRKEARKCTDCITDVTWLSFHWWNSSTRL